jgi:hypothetical protein
MKFFTCFIILLVNFCYSQNQEQDLIILDDSIYKLIDQPLEVYFERNPNLKPKTSVLSSSLHRGYRATYKFENNEMILSDLEVKIKDTIINEEKKKQFYLDNEKLINSLKGNLLMNFYKFESVITNFNHKNGKLKIKWFTGLFLVPIGKKIKSSNYETNYNNYYLIEIKNGILIAKKSFTFEELQTFRKEQFEIFKLTKEYKKTKKLLKKRYYKWICSENCIKKKEECLNEFVDYLILSRIEDYIKSFK